MNRRSVIACACLVLGGCAMPEGMLESSLAAKTDMAPNAALAGSFAPPQVDAPEAPPAPEQQRVVIYSAGLRLVVVSSGEAVRAIQTIAEQQGGYLDEMSNASVTVRVPASKFTLAVSQIEKLGEVVERNIKAQDITEQMIDLKVRLENAEATRARLLVLVKGSQKTEDTLKIEEELRRVTEIIEQAKGKIRYLESRVAMSAIKVDLNAPASRIANTGLGIPFAWVEQLGDGLVAGRVESMPRKMGIFGRGPDFKPPAGIFRYFQDDDHTEAMDGADLRLKVQDQKNLDDADITFWHKLARRVMVEKRSVAIASESIEGDLSILTGTREVAGVKNGYLLAMRRSRHSLIVFEAWGPADQFEAMRKQLEASARSIDPD